MDWYVESTAKRRPRINAALEISYMFTDSCQTGWQVNIRQWLKLHVTQNLVVYSEQSSLQWKLQTYQEAKLHSILNIGKIKCKRHNGNITQQLQTCCTLDTRVIRLSKLSYVIYTVMHISLSCRNRQYTQIRVQVQFYIANIKKVTVHKLF